MPVVFTCTREETDTIMAIVARVDELLFSSGGLSGEDKLSLTMDLTACHVTCPLDLAGLLGADVYNLIHDVDGIRRHLNRKTGKLRDCFLPRYARPTPGPGNV